MKGYSSQAASPHLPSGDSCPCVQQEWREWPAHMDADNDRRDGQMKLLSSTTVGCPFQDICNINSQRTTRTLTLTGSSPLLFTLIIAFAEL
jgi:hypothetical protein